MLKVTPEDKKTCKDHITLSAPAAHKKTFWDQVEKTKTCWLFRGKLAPSGYCRFSWKKGAYTTGHRASLLWHTGYPQPGNQACHECCNKHCVNPSHLRWDTPKNNTADKHRHGTMVKGSKHPQAKINENDVKSLWKDLQQKILRISDIAKKYGIDRTNVWLIKKGKAWKHVTQVLGPLEKEPIAYAEICRLPYQPLNKEQIDTICQMVDNKEQLKKIAAHAKITPGAIRNVYFREKGIFPDFRPSKKRKLDDSAKKMRKSPWHRSTYAAGAISPSS